MSNAFRQITGAANSGSASIALSQVYDSNITSGSLLTAYVWTDSTTATVTVSDTLNGSWTQTGSYQSLAGVGKYSMWRYIGSAAGPNTVTVTLSVSTLAGFYMMEHSGDSTITLDTAAGSTGTSTAPSPGSIAVAAAGSFVIAGFVRVTASAGFSAPTNFVNRALVGNTDFGTQISDRLSASSAQTPVFTVGSSMGWLSIGASFAVATVPPPPPPVTFFLPQPVPPQIYGMPWTTAIQRQQPFWYTLQPPPPVPPIPPIDPPPPGTHPPPPPYPDPPTLPPGSTELTAVADKIDVDKNIDPRIRRVLELLSITYNSLTGTGQIIRRGPDAFQIITQTEGLTGIY